MTEHSSPNPRKPQWCSPQLCRVVRARLTQGDPLMRGLRRLICCCLEIGATRSCGLYFNDASLGSALPTSAIRLEWPRRPIRCSRIKETSVGLPSCDMLVRRRICGELGYRWMSKTSTHGSWRIGLSNGDERPMSRTTMVGVVRFRPVGYAKPPSLVWNCRHADRNLEEQRPIYTTHLREEGPRRNAEKWVA